MNTDWLVIGGGVIGLRIAIELKMRYPDTSVTLIEKEPECGLHGSGRNSGVLHAGFYYTADSLKAKFTADGNRALREYCLQRSIPLNECGKLVVTRNQQELKTLDLLLKRGQQNGVELDQITVQEAQEIEPNVKTFERALFSPNTASVDPTLVMQALLQDAIEMGVSVLPNNAYVTTKYKTIITSQKKINAGYVVNAAGLYADKIAKDFGYSDRYMIIPFKGLYLKSNSAESSIKYRTNIYPVPDLDYPFLGVHITVNAQGQIKLGPTAVPAFWRENYKGFDCFDAGELIDVARRGLGLFWENAFGFRKLAITEFKKMAKQELVRQASVLAHGIDKEQFTQWGPAGIRAQLIDVRKKALEMDFVVEVGKDSAHVLNAVSPGFTCSFPFSKYVVQQIEEAV